MLPGPEGAHPGDGGGAGAAGGACDGRGLHPGLPAGLLPAPESARNHRWAAVLGCTPLIC